MTDLHVLLIGLACALALAGSIVLCERVRG
jgi:hypothetical protein